MRHHRRGAQLPEHAMSIAGKAESMAWLSKTSTEGKAWCFTGEIL